MQKCVLLDFYRGLVQGLQWGRTTMMAFLVVFMMTFTVSIILTFVECRPLNLYWEVVQSPGTRSSSINKYC